MNDDTMNPSTDDTQPDTGLPETPGLPADDTGLPAEPADDGMATPETPAEPTGDDPVV